MTTLTLPKSGDARRNRVVDRRETGSESTPAGDAPVGYIIVSKSPFLHGTKDSVDREKARLRGLHPTWNWKTMKVVNISGEITPAKLRRVADLLEEQLAERGATT